MAAAQIENGLIYQDQSKSFVFAFHPRVEYLDTLSAGLISISLEGEVISLNRPGRLLLAGLSTAPNSHFDALFEAGFTAALEGLLGGGVIRLRDRAGSGVFMVCRQIGARRAPPPRTGHGSSPLLPSQGAPDFVCDDPRLKPALADLAAATQLRMPVHISGETGTGKELMARHVHDLSRRKGAFVALNCGAVPEDLFMAELFGHERGAFTNARAEGAPGLVRGADGGTLFLDEVADIPLAAQTSLLRFIDSMEVRSLGGGKAERVDVQIVSATNRDLQQMVADRLFRSDLYYRLNAYPIRLPGLAGRSDFVAIVRHLMDKMAPGVPLTDAAIVLLSRRAWPGNIRELRTVLQRALVRQRDGFIDEDCFNALTVRDESGGDCCATCRPRPLSRVRCQEIRAAYRASGENISHTARDLGLSRTTVYKHVGPGSDPGQR